MTEGNPCCETQRTFSECEKPEEVNVKSRFIDLTRDYGFKIVMADEKHPQLMLGFLNAVIPEREIVSIRFLNVEMLPSDEDDHRVNYDILCTDSNGNRFVIEMQKRSYDCFADRLSVYAGGQINRLLKRSEHYTNVRTLYVISVLGGYLNLEEDDAPLKDALVRRGRLRMDDNGSAITDKENFIFVQLPAAKEPTAGSTLIEKWAWYVRNMVDFAEKPSELEPYFDLLFEASDRNNIEQGKLSIYDKMVRDEIQIAAERDYAVREAREEALVEGRAEGETIGRTDTARKMKQAGINLEVISKCSGLSIEEIEAL